MLVDDGYNFRGTRENCLRSSIFKWSAVERLGSTAVHSMSGRTYAFYSDEDGVWLDICIRQGLIVFNHLQVLTT